MSTSHDRLRPPVPRITLTRAEAAAALGVGTDFFDEHIRPELRVIYRGRKVLYPVRELERWADKNARMTLEPDQRP